MLAAFAGDEVRALLRPTRVYGALLHESFHPDVLRDALDRESLFDRLRVEAVSSPHLARVIPSERDDLQRGDIPAFTTTPQSRDLWDSNGRRLADIFDEPSLALVRRKVRQLSEHDLVQQLRFIRASLATLSPGVARPRDPARGQGEPQAAADRSRLVAAARAVGDQLEALALRGKHEASWIGLTLTAKDHWVLVPLGPDLYGGLPGVALFLGYLGALTGETRYGELARAAVTSLRRQEQVARSRVTSVGAFTGWGGVIYALAQLAVLWDEPALLAEAEDLVDLLPALIARDEEDDIIGGAAGCLASLLSLYRCAPSTRTLATATLCGDRLLARARLTEHGIGWTKEVAGGRPLTGFSHGSAGIAWALLELSALTGDERFRAASARAISHERSLFSAEAGNWPDLRLLSIPEGSSDHSQATFQTAWCHGAPGVGLARLRSLRHLDDAVIRAEIDTALRTTLSQGFGYSHCLCHGDLGNLDVLLQASQVLEDRQWPTEVQRLSALILESIAREGWLCGGPSGVGSPGLMAGLAGIGYGLLRLAEPGRVPSVLLLDPPTWP